MFYIIIDAHVHICTLLQIFTYVHASISHRDKGQASVEKLNQSDVRKRKTSAALHLYAGEADQVAREKGANLG